MKLYLHYINAVFVAAWHFLEKKRVPNGQHFYVNVCIGYHLYSNLPLPFICEDSIYPIPLPPPHESFV